MTPEPINTANTGHELNGIELIKLAAKPVSFKATPRAKPPATQLMLWTVVPLVAGQW